MKKNVTLKARETAATNSDFYNLFRPIAPSIDLIGKVAQVISALTEGVTIWYITQSEMAGSSKILSIAVSIIAMILVIAVLELGGRKFLQVLTRAIVWKRLKNAWYIGLFGIVLAITLGMGILSFNLSTNGIHHAFVSNVPVVANFDDSDLKKEYRNNVKEITRRFEKDYVLIKENYQDRIAGTKDNFDAKIESAKMKVEQYNAKYKKGAKWAKSQAEKHQKIAGTLEMEKTTLVTGIQTDHSRKLEAWQTKKDKAIEAEKERMDKAVEKGETAIMKIHESKYVNASFWGNLFSFFVGFSVILAFICIVSVEVYRRGAGIQVTYQEEEKDRSILEIFWFGLKARFDTFLRRKAEKFAKINSPSLGNNSSIGFNYPKTFATNETRELLTNKNEDNPF